MLWKLAADLNGRISSVQIFEAEPYIQINEPCRTEDQILIQTFQDVCRFWAQNDERVRRLETEVGKSYREANELKKDPETLLTDKYNVRPIDVFSYRNKILANNRKISSAYEAIRTIRQTFDDIQRGLVNYSTWTKSKDRQKRVEDIGASAIQKKYTKASRIVYKFSKEDKVSSYDDHLDIIQDDLKAEKDARYVLQELGRPTTITKIYKKEERLPTGATTGSAMRRETEASITENVEQPIESQFIIKEVTEPAQLSEIREVRDIREIRETPKAYTNNIKNVVSYTNNLNNVPKEKITYYTQDVFPSRLSGVEIEDRSRSSSEKEIISKKENINRNMEIRPAYKKIMTMPEITKETVTRMERVPEKEQLVRSMTYEQPDLRQSTVTIDVESLQREIESLRRENKTLSDKLTQSTFQTATSKIQKEEVLPVEVSSFNFAERQKDIPVTLPIQREEVLPVKVSPFNFAEKQKDVSGKSLVFIKHHIALKTWALTLRKSLRVLEASPKCIESALDLELVIVGSRTGKVSFFRFLNFSDIREVGSIQVSHHAVTTLLYLCDGKTLLCGCKDGQLLRIDLNGFTHSEILELEAPISAIVNPLRGSSFFVAAGKRLYEVDIENKFISNVVDAHDEYITCMAYNDKKEILCTGGKDNNIKIWNAQSLDCVGVLQGHMGPINSLCFAFSQNHIILCSVSKDSALILWNLTDKNLTKSLTCESPAKKILYLYDKRTILTLHKSGSFHLWNTDKITEKEFFSNKTPYTAGCYYDDGHNILLTTSEGTLEFWNAK